MMHSIYDGDEREAKKNAYDAMMMSEVPDETILQFESLEEFLVAMSPRKNCDYASPEAPLVQNFSCK